MWALAWNYLLHEVGILLMFQPRGANNSSLLQKNQKLILFVSLYYHVELIFLIFISFDFKR